LADWDWQNQQRDTAAQRYIQAIQLNPQLRTSELDALYLPTAKVELKQAVKPNEIIEKTQEKNTAEAVVAQATNILTVLITGATSGIGRATAEHFAQYGHRLILTGRRADRLSALKTQLERKSQNEVLMLPFDIRDQATVQHIFAHLPESWQNIDVLINNAGLAKGLSPIHEGSLEHWETMIDTNIKGLLYVTKAIVPGMVQRKKGHIINVGSSAGKETYPNGNVYCATKFAVDALTRAMRMDLYTHNIRVSQVSPGHVEETEFAITRFDGDQERAKIYDNFQPLKASDVAEVIYFMVSRPAHVNIQDVWMFATQQASSMLIDRSGR
jgi:NADP-dependent 3-hydroxy acid dehydrogenase YdfG